MKHGATAETGVTFLFVTNTPFANCYESDTAHPDPLEAAADETALRGAVECRAAQRH